MSATSQLRHNPNFPINLDIHPSTHSRITHLGILNGNFGFDEQKIAIREYGIAGRVWEAAYAMITYIGSHDTLEFDPPFMDVISCDLQLSIIELGSGSGLVASVIARILKPGTDLFIATDLSEVCPLLERNLLFSFAPLGSESLSRSPIVVKALSWGNRNEAIDLGSEFFGKDERPTVSCRNLTHILCSDLVYFPDLFAPLLRTLLDLTSPPFTSDLSGSHTEPILLISYKVRSLTKEASFWAAFGLWFDFNPVLVKHKSGPNSAQSSWRRFGVDCDDTTFLFVARRRPESRHWTMPLLDQDLISGVGANDSEFPKSDDKFERLLMMIMTLENE